MTDDEKRKPVQINFRAAPDLRDRLGDAVFDYGVRTGQRRLTVNEVLVDLVEKFVETEEEIQAAAKKQQQEGTLR